ncbi:MAG: prolyl-tRNA synthetase associated domain-containing protein [Pseudomonadota bacterium]
MMMSDPQTRLLAHLDQLGIVPTLHSHPPLFTVADSQALRGDLPGLHSKNLFLKDKKDALWLLVVEETRDIRINHLHKSLGCGRLSFGNPDLLFDILGVTPGSVSPFALINDRETRVNVAFDRMLMEGDTLNFHPLRNDRTAAIAPGDLLKFVESLGHHPVIIDFSIVPA